jgi:hypothetical protein
LYILSCNPRGFGATLRWYHLLQVDELNDIDVASIMYSYSSMMSNPGLVALDALAVHVNTKYDTYGPAEMAQTLYGFARLNFHPGAVVGRVMVVFRRDPGLFDNSAVKLIDYALGVLDNQNPKTAALGSPAAEQLKLAADLAARDIVKTTAR